MNIRIDKAKDKWIFCQDNSDLILSEGIEILKNSVKMNISSAYPSSPGNYLISSSDIPLYIGESRNINKRIKQQFKKGSSTFYKNYLKKQLLTDKHQEYLKIDDFDVQVMITLIGTKEIEDFGIVNLGTSLNQFQLGKRHLFEIDVIQNNWSKIQSNYEDILAQGEKHLIQSESSKWCNAKVKNGPGIYYVEHKTLGLLYIGESSNIQDRYRTHSRDTRFSALRRHIGTRILGFKLKTKIELGFKINPNKDKRMYFAEEEDKKINNFLEDCFVQSKVITFGRYELESFLIKKYKPMLNIKDNK